MLKWARKVEYQSLSACLEYLEGQHVYVVPAEIMHVFIGWKTWGMGVSDAQTFVASSVVAGLPAYCSIAVPDVPDGVYGVGPDGFAWILFHIKH